MPDIKKAHGNTDRYEYEWLYMVNGTWFPGSTGSTVYEAITYKVPTNASNVCLRVKPISKTYNSNGHQVSYWHGDWTQETYDPTKLPPETLSAPSVEINKYNLTAKLENITDARTEGVEFEVYKDDVKFTSGKTEVKTARAHFTCVVAAGGKYRVRCRAINYIGDYSSYGPWSPYSGEAGAVPAAPYNVNVEVETDRSVKISWDKSSTATGYTLEYTTNKLYFDSTSEVKSLNVATNYAIITGIDPGHEWFFRVKAKNEKGESGWSDIVYKIVGTKPQPPTTWSLTTTAIIGEPMVLYWVHNTEDKSRQKEAQIELTINGSTKIITVDTSSESSTTAKNKIYSHSLDLTEYTEGAEIFWRVRTKGILHEYSDWSIQRKINIYAPPSSELHVGNDDGKMEGYPYPILIKVGPPNQKAISYHISITSLFTYQTQDHTGKKKIINAGDELYSKIFVHAENKLNLNLLPNDIYLENNQSYKVSIVVSMDSGLAANASKEFTVSWSDAVYQPDATVTIDKETLSAYISPYCYKLVGDEYHLVEDVVLSVYRKEYDGSFTEISNNIENTNSISVTDPHPSLDYARYRIVARNINTNVIGYSDIPPIPVNEPSIVIQWDEEWVEFNAEESIGPAIPFSSGSMLRLPGNVDISENYDRDTSLIEYIGRKNPVSYYGTQQGVKGNWSADIPHYDKDTLYALRRLAVWDKDVYVREPNGIGYNATIKVSMNMKHNSLIIPVSFDVKKVEGENS